MVNSIFYTVVMILTGIGIPIMASMNARMGASLGNPALAATLLFFFAFCLSLIFLLATHGLPSLQSMTHQLPFFYYFAGFFVVFYVTSITFIAPYFGLANAVFCVLLGQIVASLLIDHYGLFGVKQVDLSFYRVLGAVFMILGIYMSRKTI